MEITIQNITIEVERKPIRNMHLSVYPPDARVHLSMPSFLSESDARSFLLKKWQWICRNREQVLKQPRQTQREYISGESHYLFGTRYMLLVEPVTSGANSITVQGNKLIMKCRPASTRDNRRAQLQEWYRGHLRTILTDLVDKWCEQLGEVPVDWTIKQMKTEWGSCIARKRHLVFNLDLARVPIECIEYIVVHELTHLAVQNHGPAFQALMTQRLPNWKLLRKQLNDFIAIPVEEPIEENRITK